ncbi:MULTISPECIES: MFS transporter [Rhodanobacter]|uniref:MFS transporter n=1 Tax=Rhodanobacter TaxID=75309 RepID=UPI0004801FC3|nr:MULTISPECIES: MFS transporter [Rhodanobacter]TAN18267.1 MAG: MFS transporter [Rhodanobacter sp.]UJJ53270.1 MFS transporter [Rhodanobacter thiooxydans]
MIDDEAGVVMRGLPMPVGACAGEAPPVRRAGWPFIAIYGMAYMGLWMALLPPILVGLAMRVSEITPAHATGSLSLVVGVGALIALFGNPFFGSLSDRTTSRFGMRRPWLIAGAAGGVVGLAVVAMAVSVPQLLLGWCITQLAYNAQLAALTAILADQIPASQRGMVSGIVGVSLPVGMVGGTYLVELLAYSALAIFLVPAVIALAGAFLLAWVLPDHHLAAMQRPRYGWREFLGSFWINPLRFPDFAWAWGSRFLLYAGVALLMTYQEFYLIHQLGCAPAAVPRWIFLSTLVQSGAVAVASVVGGGLSDARGRRKAFVCGTALIYALALLMIAFATSYTYFLVAMAITGIAQGGYLAADLALVTDVLPERETHAARNLGIFNIANVMPQSLMPAIAPGILLASGGSYTALFTMAAALVALGAWAILPVRGAR